MEDLALITALTYGIPCHLFSFQSPIELRSSVRADYSRSDPRAKSSVAHEKLRKGGQVEPCYSHLQLNKGFTVPPYTIEQFTVLLFIFIFLARLCFRLARFLRCLSIQIVQNHSSQDRPKSYLQK